ncbi:hypothetical protein [Pantoea sp. V106_11]|uniref:hypothetical protein n=1 Tax=Pantoea sp. V106_11 TaxID=3044234 RepID=UPI00249E2E25|nr:hypothetical protein [Pantoea sp. V106_11]MDI3415687.1 hypothetical protein [Pantoea sp. V106_11]
MSQAQEPKDSYFVAWRSKNGNGESIFGSIIYQSTAGMPPAKAMIESIQIISTESKIAVSDIRITSFNRI